MEYVFNKFKQYPYYNENSKNFDTEFSEEIPLEFDVDIEPDDENVEVPNEVETFSYGFATEFERDEHRKYTYSW